MPAKLMREYFSTVFVVSNGYVYETNVNQEKQGIAK